MDAELIRTKCECLMKAYRQRYDDDGYVPLSVEQTRELPIVNPDTNRTSRTFRHAGKTDCILVGRGKTVLCDHKTTIDDITSPDAPYWKILDIDSQISKYTLQEWQAGIRMDGFLYDVIHKPTIRPKKLSQSDFKKLIETSQYFGELSFETFNECEKRVVKEEKLAKLRYKNVPTENMEMYSNRLTADINANPDKYFQRRMVWRLDNEIIEYAQELWQIAYEIKEAHNNNSWFRNSAACMNYNRPCEFLGVCSDKDTIDSDKWEKVDCVHTELDIQGDGRNMLTNSSIKTFQTCRRKYRFKYVDGVRRVGDEEEALYFGKLLHEMLEEYYLNRMETPDDSDSHETEQHIPATDQQGFSW